LEAQLAAWLSIADLVVGNDSGPKHLAVAVGTPTLTLFGPENPFEWHPYPLARHPYMYIERLGCRSDQLPGYPEWCGLQGHCVKEEHRCLRDLGPDAVLRRALGLRSGILP